MATEGVRLSAKTEGRAWGLMLMRTRLLTVGWLIGMGAQKVAEVTIFTTVMLLNA